MTQLTEEEKEDLFPGGDGGAGDGGRAVGDASSTVLDLAGIQHLKSQVYTS
mgnify:CR=1 FL=1